MIKKVWTLPCYAPLVISTKQSIKLVVCLRRWCFELLTGRRNEGRCFERLRFFGLGALAQQALVRFHVRREQVHGHDVALVQGDLQALPVHVDGRLPLAIQGAQPELDELVAADQRALVVLPPQQAPDGALQKRHVLLALDLQHEDLLPHDGHAPRPAVVRLIPACYSSCQPTPDLIAHRTRRAS